MVKKTTDMELVAKIINHPDVYSWVTDDLSPDEYVPDGRNLYIINDEGTAVVMVSPLQSVTCTAHIATTPDLCGTAKDFVQESIKWGWANTRYSKIVCIVPVFNKRVARLCIGCGFKKEGTITKSFLKNFQLCDQDIYGMSKYDSKGDE
jgi:hypothetical protein